MNLFWGWCLAGGWPLLGPTVDHQKCVPQPIEICLNERDEKDIKKAATLADQFELTIVYLIVSPPPESKGV